MLRPKKIFAIMLFIIGIPLGIMLRTRTNATLLEKVYTDTGCPKNKIQVKWRSSRSSYADVEACGKSYVYHVSQLSNFPERVSEP